MAEATLLVTGGQGPGKVTKCSVQAAELQENGRAVAVEPSADQTQASIELVGCGRPLMGEEVLIVDPDTRLPCEDSVVGEIWIGVETSPEVIEIARPATEKPLADNLPIREMIPFSDRATWDSFGMVRCSSRAV